MRPIQTICGKSAPIACPELAEGAPEGRPFFASFFWACKKRKSPKAKSENHNKKTSLLPLTLCLLLFACQPPTPQIDPDLLLPKDPFPIGGDFTLTDHNNKPFHLSDQDHPYLIFFGYTSCPDACPQTLARIASAYTLLDDNTHDLKTLFISVDPNRDPPQALKTYLSHFDVPAIGLTGSRDSINAVVKRYAAHYEINDQNSAAGYLIDHSLYTYLIDRNGNIRFLFRASHTAEDIATVVRQLSQ